MRLVSCLAGLALALLCAAPRAAAQPPSAITVSGDHTPFYALFDKIRRGQTINIVFFGGSFSACAGASQIPATCWTHWTNAWLVDTMGARTNVTLAGVGGTNSVYGQLRLQQDVLSKDPDLVLLDFSANDAANCSDNHAYESVIRNLRKRQIATLIIMFTDGAGDGRQNCHVPLAEHYKVPAISYRDPTEYRIRQGVATWAQLTSDGVHMSDLGHRWAGGYVKELLSLIKAEHDALRTLPPPLTDNRMENVSYRGGPAFAAALSYNAGWWLVGNQVMESTTHWNEMRLDVSLGGGRIWAAVYREAGWGNLVASLDGTIFILESMNRPPGHVAVLEWDALKSGGHTGTHTLGLINWPGGGAMNKLWVLGIGTN
jgi:lysophospholipase L1-like esterase